MALLRMSPDTVHPLEAMMTPITADPMEQYERMQAAQPMARPANQGLGGENEPGHAVQMSPLDPYEEALRTKQMSDIRKDQNPYGSTDNHPGALGKILHGLSVATGGPNRRQFAEEGREKQIAGIESEKSKNALEGAQAANAQASAGKTNAETSEVAPNAESLRREQGARTEDLESETRDRDLNASFGPSLATAYAHRVNQVLGSGGDPADDPIVQHLSDAITSIQRQPAGKGMEHVSFMSGGKQMDGNYDPASGHYYDLKGNLITDAQPIPTASSTGAVTMIVPADPNNPNAGGTVQRLTPGSHVAPGAMTPSQVGQGTAADIKQGKADARTLAQEKSDYRLMQTLAANPSPTNDLAMVMHYIGATKPDSIGKLRLNQNEIALVMGTRSTFGDLEALAQKVENGQKLTPQQRSDMLATMRILSQSEENQNTIVQHSPSTGQYRYSIDGGKTWQAGQPKQQ